MKITKKQLAEIISKVILKESSSNMSTNTSGHLVKYSGILKLVLPQNIVNDLKSILLPMNAIRLSENAIHITLLHQSAFKDPTLKPQRKIIKKTLIPAYDGPLQFNNNIIHRVDEELGRETWALFVDEQTQEALKDYVLQFIEMYAPGESQRIVDTYDAARRFHISVANLTGNPGDSVR